MKKGWRRKRLGDVLEIQNGYAFDSAGFNPTKGMPLVRIRSLKSGTETETRFDGDHDKKYVVKAGDLLIGMDGEFGCYEWKGEPALLNQRVCRLQGFTGELVPRFLFYGVNDYLKAIEDVTGYATVKHLSSKQVLAIEFPVPPLPEQRRIVGILDEAFAGIATAKANAEKNLQNARAIFESHLQSVFTKRGDGWVETTIGEVCTLRSGTTLPKEIEKSSGEIPYLKVADMSISDNLNGVTRSSRYVNKSDVNANNLLPVGATIFPKRGGAILTNKKRLTKRVICADLNIMGVTPGKALLPQLLYFYFLNVDMRELGSGSSIPQINNYDIEPMAISFPNLQSEQITIVKQLESLSAETQSLASVYQRKLAALEALKKSLLHQAFNGELSTPQSVTRAMATV